MEDIGIDFEGLLTDARQGEMANKLITVVRMGGAFNEYGDTSTLDGQHEKAAFAMSVTGLDASLKFHGIESARRINTALAMAGKVTEPVKP